MKYLAIALILALAFFGYRHFHTGAAPAASEVRPLLASYLALGKGNCSVAHLSDISVGEFSSQFGGWPVYASHEETCRDGDTSTTYAGLDDAKKQVAAAFVRRGGTGGLEVFVLQFFQDAQQQMSQEGNRPVWAR
jgi:hypothetical protein